MAAEWLVVESLVGLGSEVGSKGVGESGVLVCGVWAKEQAV